MKEIMAERKPTETPMMKQFFAMKAQHPEAVLLFRCGDFYETYGDDALTASKVLGIVLQSVPAPFRELFRWRDFRIIPSRHTFPDLCVQATRLRSATSWKTLS